MRRNVSISINRTKIEKLLDWKGFPSKYVGRFSFQCLTVMVAWKLKGQRAMCINRQNGPSGAKNGMLCFINFLQLVCKKNSPSVISWILLYFYHCYGNKNGGRSKLKIEKLPFLANLKAFGDRFFLMN